MDRHIKFEFTYSVEKITALEDCTEIWVSQSRNTNDACNGVLDIPGGLLEIPIWKACGNTP